MSQDGCIPVQFRFVEEIHRSVTRPSRSPSFMELLVSLSLSVGGTCQS